MASESGCDSTQMLLAELVKTLNSQRPCDNIDLLFFRPGMNNSNKWVSHVQKIKHELDWSDVQVLAKIVRFLLSDAKRWYERWNPDNRY
ncbi:hypothetical protein WA026_012299 [Henosepilachna vigintioctopunctata]|uniref:Uncharacterized protein n=1 Tax=Henosepilachna vigintioctopunctata TaxID=420089 RepID=A0AAW1UXC5_9CUCU